MMICHERHQFQKTQSPSSGKEFGSGFLWDNIYNQQLQGKLTPGGFRALHARSRWMDFFVTTIPGSSRTTYLGSESHVALLLQVDISATYCRQTPDATSLAVPTRGLPGQKSLKWSGGQLKLMDPRERMIQNIEVLSRLSNVTGNDGSFLSVSL